MRVNGIGYIYRRDIRGRKGNEEEGRNIKTRYQKSRREEKKRNTRRRRRRRIPRTREQGKKEHGAGNREQG